MRPAGLAAFEARTPSETAIYSYERPVATLSEAETARFRADAAAWADWERRPPSYRRAVTHWVTSAEARRDPPPAVRGAARRLGGGAARQADARGAERCGLRSPGRWSGPSRTSLRSDLGDAFDPRAAHAIVEAGLHRLCVPASAGGLGASMGEAAEVLLAIGALDGATALGFAMQVHVTGALRDAPSAPAWPRSPSSGRSSTPSSRRRARQQRLDRGGRRFAGPWRDPRHDRGDSGRSARRGGLAPDRREDVDHLAPEPDPCVRDRATRDRGDAAPAARDGRPRWGRSWSISRRPASSAEKGSRRWACADRRRAGCVLEDAPASLVAHRPAGSPDPRGAAPGAWFAMAVAATYLGVGEGARADVVRWAVDRRPGDGRTAVAELPTVQLRLGRLDAALRAARIVVLDAAGAGTGLGLRGTRPAPARPPPTSRSPSSSRPRPP